VNGLSPAAHRARSSFNQFYDPKSELSIGNRSFASLDAVHEVFGRDA
jgi:hypothetical protein